MLPPKVKIEVYGLRWSKHFQHARLAAMSVATAHKRDVEAASHDLNENDWDIRRFQLKQEHPGASLYEEDVVVLCNDQVQANLQDFLGWIEEEYSYNDSERSESLLNAITAGAEKAYRESSKSTFVFMDVSIGDEAAGQLVFELFSKKLPKTCENFAKLCTGEQDSKTRPGEKLHYANSLFHRVQKHGWIQGGDIFGSSGDKGESIYGETFEDENFTVPFSKRGVLAMANDGIHTNSSQFFITFRELDWMNTKFVAFGQLYKGVELLRRLENAEVYNQRPLTNCKITACGLCN